MSIVHSSSVCGVCGMHVPPGCSTCRQLLADPIIEPVMSPREAELERQVADLENENRRLIVLLQAATQTLIDRNLNKGNGK